MLLVYLRLLVYIDDCIYAGFEATSFEFCVDCAGGCFRLLVGEIWFVCLTCGCGWCMFALHACLLRLIVLFNLFYILCCRWLVVGFS